MTLDARQTTVLAILVLFLGKYLNARIGVLREYNIPEPVTGGVIASLGFAMLTLATGIEIDFSLHTRDVLLVIFFTTIGLSSRFSTLMQGGRQLGLLLITAVVYLYIQNLTGVAAAASAGYPLVVGVLSGSVSLSGGHGTAIAWAPIFVERYGIEAAMEIGIACATFGLVLGGIVGGPIAKRLIRKYALQPESYEAITVGTPHDAPAEPIDRDTMLRSLLVISVTLGVGIHMKMALDLTPLSLPVFVPCLFAGILATNTVPVVFKRIHWPTGTPSLALIADLCLGLFLAMSLMSLDLLSLVGMAGPILYMMLGQLVVVVVVASVVVFRLLGSNYEAAVMASGYAGLALGATPTAIANMTAVTEKSGAAPRAFIVVPLVGAFFIDIANAFVIETMLKLVS